MIRSEHYSRCSWHKHLLPNDNVIVMSSGLSLCGPHIYNRKPVLYNGGVGVSKASFSVHYFFSFSLNLHIFWFMNTITWLSSIKESEAWGCFIYVSQGTSPWCKGGCWAERCRHFVVGVCLVKSAAGPEPAWVIQEVIRLTHQKGAGVSSYLLPGWHSKCFLDPVRFKVTKNLDFNQLAVAEVWA